LIECEKAGELATYWNLKNETNNENWKKSHRWN
jgi:hypothetical protein